MLSFSGRSSVIGHSVDVDIIGGEAAIELSIRNMIVDSGLDLCQSIRAAAST